MKKIATLVMSVCAMAVMASGQVNDSVWSDDVKTVSLWRDGVELEEPVLSMENNEKMLLQFDIIGSESDQWRWRIVHCDRNWIPDDLQAHEFMEGFESGSVEGYDFSFTTLKSYVHYYQTIPETYSRFVYSGNYVLYVYHEDEPDSIIISRRFMVSEQNVAVEATTTKPYDGMAIDKRQQVDVKLSSRRVQLNTLYTSVLVKQNGRQDNARWLEFSGYDAGRMVYANRPANIFDGGNTFRFFDMSNINTPMYNVLKIEEYGGEKFVILTPCEDRSRKHFIADAVLAGGMKVNIWNRNNPAIEADYVWVNFFLPVERPYIDGTVHIVGALTDWRLDDNSMMEYNNQSRSYVKRMLLKQGYYSYQLLYKPMREGAGYTSRLEGDHRETPNQYTVFVYYRNPTDLADRLLSVRRVVVQ